MDKNQVIESFSNLPDLVTVDQLIERILFIRLINERLQKIEQEPGTPHDVFMRELDEFKAKKRAEKQATLS